MFSSSSDDSPVVVVSKRELSCVIGLSVMNTYMAVVLVMGAAAAIEYFLAEVPVERSPLAALATCALGLIGLIVAGMAYRRFLPGFLSKEWVEKRQALTSAPGPAAPAAEAETEHDDYLWRC